MGPCDRGVPQVLNKVCLRSCRTLVPMRARNLRRQSGEALRHFLLRAQQARRAAPPRPGLVLGRKRRGGLREKVLQRADAERGGPRGRVLQRDPATADAKAANSCATALATATCASVG